MSPFVQLRRAAYSPVRVVRAFLPTRREEVDARGWRELGFATMTPIHAVRELRYSGPLQHDLAREALHEAGRRDLIGHHANALVPSGLRRRRSSAGESSPHGGVERDASRRRASAPARGTLGRS